MHAVLYVCLPRSEARNSLQARKNVCEFLSEKGFDRPRKAFGRCDYFSVGGRASGRLSLLRLRHQQPKQFDRFWKTISADSYCENPKVLFHKTFPKYPERLPLGRPYPGFYGAPDDAQIMDEPLFKQLKRGFSEEVNYAYELKEPNVIFANASDDDFVWPKTNKQASDFWVVVIDYHA